MTRADDIQLAVEELAVELALPVLVEDARFQPLWWSAQGAVDGHRVRSIMQRTVHPAAAAMVKRLKIATAMAPVRTAAVPEAEMVPRWCLPLRTKSRFLGFLWIIDPDGNVGADGLALAATCAALATAHLAHAVDDLDSHDRRRTELLEHLQAGPDGEAARNLVALERLDPGALIVVHAPGLPGGWKLADGLSGHVVRAGHDRATSGAPVPLRDLSVAVHRAGMTRRVLATGAHLERPSWDALGSWHLVIAAPPELTAADIHPGADRLSELPRPDLSETARTTLELGGDVAKAAAVLHIHRTTLYYRLDRIAEITGVDVRTSPDRLDLQMALRLTAFRSVAD